MRFAEQQRFADVRRGGVGRTDTIGALLRREGLFYSHLTKWRAQHRSGAIRGLAPQRRGPRPLPVNPFAQEVADLRRQVAALESRLAQAVTIVEIQKKVSQLLGIPLDPPRSDARRS